MSELTSTSTNSSTSTPIPALGFAPEEVRTDQPTRAARLKWVVVADRTLPAGLRTNAVACVAAATGDRVTGLIARGGQDASGTEHPGLPWAGCTVLGADPDDLTVLLTRAGAAESVLVVAMPAAAQTHRVYDGYLDELAQTPPEKLACGALSIVGPRNKVDKMIKKFPLLN